jgi:hypothetical protein
MSTNIDTVANNYYGAGVTAADNRSAPGTVNYQSGYNAGYSDGAPSTTLLWTNSNPNSAFPAQTLSINLSSYDSILIFSKHSYDSSTSIKIGIIPVNGSFHVLANGGGESSALSAYGTTRGFIATTGGIAISTGGIGSQNSDGWCTPQKIIGIKGLSGLWT